MDFLSDHVSSLVEKAMDGYLLRQKAITSNIANADTPGYKRRDVSFESLLKNAVNSWENGNTNAQDSITGRLTHKGTTLEDLLQTVSPQIETLEASGAKKDANSVDVEYEMAMLAKNAGRYKALAKMEQHLFKNLRGVITGGGA